MHKQHHLPSAFAELGIGPPILQALEKISFIEPSEIQKQLIPLILQGRDVLGQARTGTGKTAAFGLPILQLSRPESGLQSLILEPTRELAVQVAAEMRRMGIGTNLHVVPVYGGQKISTQVHLLGKKPHVVVGTPGRVMDLLRRGVLRFDAIRFAVLDEVDRMLDIGFRDDIRTILSQIKTEHQTTVVSATVTDEIKRLVERYTNDLVEVNVSRDELTVDEVKQTFVTVGPWDKFEALRCLLQNENCTLAIVFCNTKHAARRLGRRLIALGVNAKEIHGDLVQQKRERVMEHFRKHRVRVLVATDLASRGIDVHDITHIINYDMPDDPHIYVHRIGRTARMGSFGKAISLVTREQGKQLTEIELLINKQIEQDVIEGFQPQPEPSESAPREAAPAAARTSRYEASVYSTAPSEVEGETSPQGPAKPKTLGSKFRPARRRRRL